MSAKSYDLMVTAGLGVVAMAGTLAGGNHPAARMVLGALLVLVLPGYALVEALLPRPNLLQFERLLFGVGLSLALAVVGGFVLNFTPWGLRPGPWAVLLGSATLGACLVAAWRRQRQQLAGPYTRGPGEQSWRHSWRQALLFGLAAAMVTGALVVASSGAASHPWAGFTQLWLLPTEETAPSTVRLGVANYEGSEQRYTIEVVQGGARLFEEPMTLEAGGRWEVLLTLPENLPLSEPVEARLYRADAPETAYRWVRLWLNEAEEQQ